MKKIKLLSIFLLVLICCTGCVGNSEVTRDLRHAGYTLSSDEFSCEALIPKSGKEYEVIKYLGSSYAITTTGVIYELSFGQMFSNNEYCMKNESAVNVKAIIGTEAYKGTDDKIYYLPSSTSGTAYTEVTSADSNYATYKYFFDDSNIVKVQSTGDSTYFVLKADGIVYKYVLEKNNSGIRLVSTEKVYSSESYGGDILDFNYAGESSTSTYIKTDNSYYRVSAVNHDECSKYIDVVCEYTFGKDEYLTAHYDHIMAFNGSRIITDYLKVFNLSSSSS